MSKEVWKAFPEVVPRLEAPRGWSLGSLKEWLAGFDIDDAAPGMLRGYLEEDFQRFVLTFNLAQKHNAGGPILDVGANPYFTTTLARKFINVDTDCINYFRNHPAVGHQQFKSRVSNEVFDYHYSSVNIEESPVPFDRTYGLVLFCEVIEHLTMDPLTALLHLRDKLRPDGYLIVTTPNVSRLENVAKMIAGANIYDPYSGYGQHGRHNREYNKHELAMLARHAGFSVEYLESYDVHHNSSAGYYPLDKLRSLTANRSMDLGQYLFMVARPIGHPKRLKPSWLFRSFPVQEMENPS